MGFEGLADKASSAVTAPEETTAPGSGDSAPGESGSSDLAPGSAEGSEAGEEGVQASSSEAKDIQDLIDLDKIEKFRLHGEEWTRDKLASSMLRQADYTRKTQEFSKERKFYDNLGYDIANVLKNPSLIEQFKKIYPEKFHRYLDAYSDFLQTKSEDGKAQKNEAKTDPQLMSRINQIESRFRDQEVKAADAMLDGLFKKYSEKYPYADEASVISKSLALMQQRKANGDAEDLTQRDWDAVFKSENDRVHALAERQYKETVSKQLKANKKAKDTATGGEAAGQSPARLTFKEATEAAIRELQRQ